MLIPPQAPSQPLMHSSCRVVVIALSKRWIERCNQRRSIGVTAVHIARSRKLSSSYPTWQRRGRMVQFSRASNHHPAYLSLKSPSLDRPRELDQLSFNSRFAPPLLPSSRPIVAFLNRAAEMPVENLLLESRLRVCAAVAHRSYADRPEPVLRSCT